MEKLSENTNALNWFEIPVTDVERAKKFYESLFDIKMEGMEMMGMQMIFFPTSASSGKVSGALVKSDFHKPSQDGAIVYLNANPNVQGVIDKVESNGGKIVMPRTEIGNDNGFMAFFIDTEGNRVGLHGMS